MRAVAVFVSGDGPPPRPLQNAWRIERYGPPFEGGWMRWPLRWLTPVETASSVYESLVAVNRANKKLKGDELDEWVAGHAGAVRQALAVEKLMAEYDEVTDA